MPRPARSAWLRPAHVGPAIIATLAAAAVVHAYDVGYTLARGTTLDAGYMAATTVVSALFAAAAGVLGGLVGSPRLALAIWVAGLAAVQPFQTVPEAAASAAGLGLAALLPSGAGGRPLRAGIGVGLAFAVALGAWPRLQSAVAPLQVTKALGHVEAVVLFAAVLVGLALASRAQLRWLPATRALPLAPLVAVALVASFLVTVGVSVRASRHAVHDGGADRAARVAPAGADHPLLLVLVLDTVRADHLSLYGYERDTTPELRRFVATHPRAVVHPFAFSNGNWTLPSHASLLTGLMPSDHEVHLGRVPEFIRSPVAVAPLAAEETLGERLRARGYRSIGIFANPVPLRAPGLMRGFDVFFQPAPVRPHALMGEPLRAWLAPGLADGVTEFAPSAQQVNRELLRHLDDCGDGACFVLANYMEAHEPYRASGRHAGAFGGDRTKEGPRGATVRQTKDEIRLTMDRYDEELLDLDDAIGDLLEALEARGVLDRAWLFIVSDHGEAFVEHGDAAHGSSLYNSQVRIPFVVHPPAGVTLAGAQHPVDLLDVAATLAAVSGAGPFGAGRDLRVEPASPRAVQIEAWGYGSPQRFGPLATVPSRAVVIGRDKLIEHGERHELYDLAADPDEQSDRVVEQDGRRRALAAELPPLRAGGPPRDDADAGAPSPDQRDELRALGYLE